MYLFQHNTSRGQAEAVLAYLSDSDGIDESWNDETKDYDAMPKVAEWHNGRERGFVITMRSGDHKRQINIAFFEHRNSDNICAVMWEQRTMNPPTIINAEFGDVYKDKWDVSKSVSVGECMEMADWIREQLIEFWEAPEPSDES